MVSYFRKSKIINKLNYNIMRKEIEKILEQVRPGLQMDGGDVELVDVADGGVVRVRLQGACRGCPMAAMTLQMGIERTLKQQIPEVTAVEAVSDVEQTG